MNTGKMNILVVEDERIVAEDIKMRLQNLGYTVPGIAFSGEEALKKAENIQPDLVLMDIVLEKKMSGIEAASIISSCFNIPIVYLTAYADDKTLERAKITEPFGYILKPFEDRELYTTIEMAFYKFKMGNMLKESEERYRGVVENAHDAIYIINQNGFQYANPAFEKLVGWGKKELCKKEFSFWDIVHPDDKKLIQEKKEVWKKGKEAPNSHEFRIISKDGGERAVEANTINIGKNGDIREIGILRDITVRKIAQEELLKSLEGLQKTSADTTNALVSALEMRDPYSAGHQKRVANLAWAVAEEMGLSGDRIEGIRLAGLIHDVGKIQIPTEILIKPGLLSEIEMLMIKMHPKIGFEIVQTIEFSYPVAQIILQHHERMNGSGYPAGLAADKILIEARILAAADVVEAMSSPRSYRPAHDINMIIKEINENKGILYDTKAADACLKLLSKKRSKSE